MRILEIDKELLQEFLEEGLEILTEWEHSAMELEDESMQINVLKGLSRSAHNLKGVSKSIGLVEFSDFVHKVEDFIVLIKEKGNIQVDQAIRILLDSKDLMASWLQKTIEDPKFVPKESYKDIGTSIEEYVQKYATGEEKNSQNSQASDEAVVCEETALDSHHEPPDTSSDSVSVVLTTEYLGSLLLKDELISKERLLECLVEKIDCIPRLSRLVYEKKLLDMDQQLEVFKYLSENSTNYIGACKALNLWNKNFEKEVLSQLEDKHKTLSEIMISKNYLSWEQLIDAFDRFLNSEEESNQLAENSKVA